MMMSGFSSNVAIGALGLFVGTSSQLILNCLLLRTFQLPVSLLFLSVLWSAGTVLAVLAGCCLVLPDLVVLNVYQDQRNTDATNEVAEPLLPATDKNQTKHKQLRLVRAETLYIAYTLMGVIMAWILIDVTNQYFDTIVPNFVMMAIALIILISISYWFPEDECLTEQEEMESSEATRSTTTMTRAAGAMWYVQIV